MNNKVICNDCDWRGTHSELLESINSFLQEIVFSCPNCKSTDNFSRICDEKDCWSLKDVGFATEEGYKFFCYKHVPKT